MASFRFSDPELAENIDHLERYLLTYESALTRGEEDTSQVQFIFRYAHNLKSSLGMLGFSDASALLHKVESCFDLVRNARKRATADLSRTALQVVDIVRANLQAPEGSGLPDTGAIEKILGDFVNAESDEDMSVPLPFALGLAQAQLALQELRDGRRLWVIDKLITTNINQEFFDLLPCFDQAQGLGQLIDFQPKWENLPKTQTECVLRLLVSSLLDDAGFAAQVHDSFRPVRPPVNERVFVAEGLPPDLLELLTQFRFKPVAAIPQAPAHLVAVGLGSPALTSQQGRRVHGQLVLALGNFNASIKEKLSALDSGADALATDRSQLERELEWLDALSFTGMGASS